MANQLADAHKAFDVPHPFTNTDNFNSAIPERQVYSVNEKFSWKIGSRNAKVSGGFMEKFKHGYKETSTFYLDSENPDPKNPKTRLPGNYNIGIDYVVDGDKQVTPWYSGVVTKSGLSGAHGNSVTVKTNQSYEY